MGGEFGYVKAVNCAKALFCYSLGLSLVALVRILVPAFYSLQDTKTPVKIAFAAFIFNFLFSLVLMGPLRHGGLALASSLSALCQMSMLLYFLRKKIGRLGGRKIMVTAAKTLAASLPMAVAVYLFIQYADWSATGQKLIKGGVLGGAVVGGVLLFFFFAYLLRMDEMREVVNTVQRRFAIK